MTKKKRAKKKARKTPKKAAATRKKKSVKKKPARKKPAKKKPAKKRPRGRPRKPASEKKAAAQKPRCQGTRVDGQPCTAAAVAQGFCGRHKGQADKPATWLESTVEEIERRKQFALMRRRELEVAEKEAHLVDAGLATAESMRIAGLIQDRFATIAARRSHELAARLGVKTGDVAAALEQLLREELREMADSL